MILAQRTPLPPPLVAGEIVQASWGFLWVLAAPRELLAVMRCRRCVGSWAVVRKLACPSAASPWQRDICLLACACRDVWLLLMCVRWVLVMIICDMTVYCLLFVKPEPLVAVGFPMRIADQDLTMLPCIRTHVKTCRETGYW